MNLKFKQTLIKIAMTNSTKIRLIGAMMLIFFSSSVMAQQAELQYFRYNDKRGLNVFENSKTDTIKFDGLKVRVGGDFAIQFQALDQSSGLPTNSGVDTLAQLGNNFNLPTANFNLDVQLAKGVRLHMRTYLSSRHHNEGWVKGGYLQIDDLDFISEGFLSELMAVTTFRFGYNDINYGDTHFRRSDNATVIYNPFVENYIMDSFTTEPFGEVTVQKSGFLGVVGVTNGRLNQNTADPTSGSSQLPGSGDGGPSFYAKLGYDKQINEDFRLRLTGSVYNSSEKSTRDYIYGGDRAGSRYYEIYNRRGENNDFYPRHTPYSGPGVSAQNAWLYLTAFQFNPFIKFKGFEVFGVYEIASNGNDDVGGKFTQTAADLLYRFGGSEQFYIGARLNGVNGFQTSAAEDANQERKINRQNYAFGWFMTDNIIVKLEYVTEKRKGDGWNGTQFQDAQFDGFMLEAAISF
jgi:hypothetical protein